MSKEIISEYMRENGRKGGLATKDKYGDEYLRKLAQRPRKKDIHRLPIDKSEQSAKI